MYIFWGTFNDNAKNNMCKLSKGSKIIACELKLIWQQIFWKFNSTKSNLYYSHVPNKCEVMITDFEKFHPL